MDLTLARSHKVEFLTLEGMYKTFNPLEKAVVGLRIILRRRMVYASREHLEDLFQLRNPWASAGFVQITTPIRPLIPV
jgi:hypothetical protein